MRFARAAMGVALVVAGAAGACGTLRGEAPGGSDVGDAGPEGASPPPERDADGLDAGGGDAARFCASVDATFCDDFDDGLALSAHWPSVTQNGSGVLASTDAALSPPNALAASESNGNGEAKIVRRFAKAGNTLTLDFDMRIDALPPDGGTSDNVELLRIGGDAANVLVQLAGKGFDFWYWDPDAGAYWSSGAGTPPAAGGWAHYTFVFDFGKQHATVSINGVGTYDSDSVGLLPDAGCDVSIGLYSGSSVPGPVAVTFDDVVVRWK